jgi:acetyltransferase
MHMDHVSQSLPALPPPEVVTLRDGSKVTLRPIQPDDADSLQATFLRLSPQSIYYRFMSYKKVLTDAEARHLAQVDYRTHMAFVAIYEEEAGPVVVGVSRYALLDPAQPNLAESAVVVTDDFQHRGLGGVLLDRLVRYARTQGVRYFRGIILLENQRIIDIVTKAGMPYEKRYTEGHYDITIDIGL